MTEETNTNTGTEASVEGGTQTQEKTFTQAELDSILKKRLANEAKRYDVEEYNNLKAEKKAAEEKKLREAEKFDELFKKQADEYTKQMEQLRSELKTVKVDGALVDAASKHKAVSPAHVAKLLRESVKLNEKGQAVVLDENGEVRYNTTAGEPLSIDAFVEEFLNENTYFKAAGPKGSGSTSNTQNRIASARKLEDLDLSDPKDREIYRQMQKEGRTGIA